MKKIKKFIDFEIVTILTILILFSDFIAINLLFLNAAIFGNNE